MLELKVDASDLIRVRAQLRAAGNPKQINKDLTKGLRKGAVPASRAVKAAARALPDKPGNATRGLRRRMASATGIQVRTGGTRAAVAVRVRRSPMGDQAALVRLTNKGSWRHKVFARPGKRQVWVVQTSRRGWFDTAVRQSAAPVRRELKAVLDDIEKKLKHT